jgi:hypothetical protein
LTLFLDQTDRKAKFRVVKYFLIHLSIFHRNPKVQKNFSFFPFRNDYWPVFTLWPLPFGKQPPFGGLGQKDRLRWCRRERKTGSKTKRRSSQKENLDLIFRKLENLKTVFFKNLWAVFTLWFLPFGKRRKRIAAVFTLW